MNRCDIQKNAMVSCEEMRRSVSGTISFSDAKCPIVRPKPRRVGFLASHPPMSLRWCKRSPHGEQLESKGGAELLDLILNRDGQGKEDIEVSSSPPFFGGSPPSRVSNPIVQDVNFGNEKKLSPFSTLQFLSSASSGSPSPASPSHKGGCARMKFGLKPAAVRIEGFDCIGRDHQNSGITAVA